MALRINTNIAAMNAHKNMIKNDSGLSASLEKLSSGLRINKAADDASGMAIADALKSQALGLGQAVRNANDGISMVQTADGALDESINIVNTIKTKAIQAAQDGQTTESRKAIQSDINKLLEELDIIAKTTAFNGQKLLSGNFTNKAFQIGAYSQETVGISIASGESSKIGHVTNSVLSFNSTGTAELSLYSNIQDATYNLNSIDIQYNNSRENSLGAVADAINKLSDVLGVSATAVVRSTTEEAVAAGTTDNDFKINGVTIGEVQVQNNDSDGSLVKAINGKTSEHGVYASVDAAGKLTLTSTDGRAIELTGASLTFGTNTGVNAVLGQTNMSTLGVINLTQTGSAEVQVYNGGSAGVAIATETNIEVSADTSATSASSSLAAGSILGSSSSISAGTVFTNAIAVDGIAGTTGAITAASGSVLLEGTVLNAPSSITSDIRVAEIAGTNADMVLGEGSQLAAGSILYRGTNITSNVTLSADTGVIAGGTITVGGGSVLKDTSVIGAGTTFQGLLSVAAYTETGTSTLGAGTVLANLSTIEDGAIFSTADRATISATSNAVLDTTDWNDNGDGTWTFAGLGGVADAELTLSGAVTLADNATIVVGGGQTVLAADTKFATNTVLADDATLNADGLVSGGNMVLEVGSNIISGSMLAANSVASVASGEDLTISAATLSASMTLLAGSTIRDNTVLAAGSVTAGTDDLTTIGTNTLTASMTITAGSTIIGGSTLASGSSAVTDDLGVYTATTLSRTQVLNSGSVIGANSALASGSTFGADIVLGGTEVVSAGATMNLAANSILKAGSILAQGTVLTNSVKDSSGNTHAAGTTLTSDVTLGEDTTFLVAQDIKGGSSLAAGSTLAANSSGAGLAFGSVGDSTMTRLSEVNVLTQEGAQIAIAVADSALKDLDKARADLGSVQNQLTSTIANLSATRVNIAAAESTIRDVDFAEEAANFSKMQILNQAGSFAMAQANASSQTVLSLLQG